MWKPGEHQLDQLHIRYTYVSTEGPAYIEHFGAKEHNYSHWPSLNHKAGWWDLQRLTLPRICHFLDLVLPQLTPVRAPWADATRTLWTCHHIRASSYENGSPYEPRVTIAYFFTSHDHIHHVRVLWGTSPLLLFSDPRMVYPVSVYEFQGQAVHRLHQQHIQLGLRKGMAVLVYYRVQSGPYANEVFQAVEARTNCGSEWSLQRPSLPGFPLIFYGHFVVMPYAGEGTTRTCLANIFIVDMVFLGDARSAEELAVFTNMAPERLCLGCGLRVEEKFTPIFPGERGPLFAASVKLLQFALRASSASAYAKELTEDEEALLQAIRPLVVNPDCHFLAVLTALVQAILEGRTDCPISGVFGAGKTRAAAAMIAGLLVMDPTLKVMVVTKENAAAHAFAKHIESLRLPPSLEAKFGRLVGATELEKGLASQTKLDVLPGNRNTVLRTKQVIIGCGGGFHQECTQPYSPIARWMAEVDVALNDEGQQYGNLDEASAIARVPRKGLVIWCGDHKQTPRGLRKSDEARAFRRKLMRRPHCLEGRHKVFPTAYAGRQSIRMCKMHRGPKLLDWASSFRKAPGNHLNYPREVLPSSKSCAKKLLAAVGKQVLLRAAVQRLLCCGWRWPQKDFRYKLILSAALQEQPASKDGP